MFKKLFLSLALLTPFTGMCASGVPPCESFTDANGCVLNVRLARAEDFKHPSVIRDWSEGTILAHRDRLEANQTGLFVIESPKGDILDRLLVGIMPLGYQPWPPTTEDDKKRSEEILSFYAALLRSIRIEPSPCKKHRDGAKAGENLVLIHPDVVAMTLVWGSAFATISAQQAIAKIVRSQRIETRKDPGVTKPGHPSFFVSITQMEGLESTDTTTVYTGLPYYPSFAAGGGLWSAIVTPIAEGVVLPKPGAYQINNYSGLDDLPLS